MDFDSFFSPSAVFFIASMSDVSTKSTFSFALSLKLAGYLTLRFPTGHIWAVNGRALCTTCDVINLNVTGHSL